MSAVTKVRCPGCKNLLRIPTDWLAKPIRCKHCAKRFRAALKDRPAEDAAQGPPPQQAAAAEFVPPPPPRAEPAPAETNVFAFDATADAGGLDLTSVEPVLRYQS